MELGGGAELNHQTKKKMLIIGSFLLGFGFMGAMDGIIFHQLLQWHSVIMETSRSGQIISDGIFHFSVTIALVVGGFILWLADNPLNQKRGIKLVLSWFLIGTGLFNLTASKYSLSVSKFIAAVYNTMSAE